jgi:phosphoribosylaminoimidazole (AIR) synthetase
MYRVFNMGIGMVLIVSPAEAPRILTALSKARLPGRIIGDIVRGSPPVQFAN